MTAAGSRGQQRAMGSEADPKLWVLWRMAGGQVSHAGQAAAAAMGLQGPESN